MSNELFAVSRLTARNFPSRDQSLAISISPHAQTSFSDPVPATDFSKRLGVPVRSDEKIRRVPSGDQTGAVPLESSNISRDVTPRARSRTQMPFLPERAAFISIATREPSGESAVDSY